MGVLDRLRRYRKPLIPTVDPFELVDSELPIHLQFYAFASGSLTLMERVVLNALIKRCDPRTVFEIGTFDGRTTLNIAANLSPNGVVHTLDLPRDLIDSTKLSIEGLDRQYIDKATSGERYRGREWQGRIRQLYGDTASFDFSSFYHTTDFVFVDGSHSYDYVLNDSEVAVKLRTPTTGVILWHDYNRPKEWPGLMRAMDELYSTRHEFRGLRHLRGTSFVLLAESLARPVGTATAGD